LRLFRWRWWWQWRGEGRIIHQTRGEGGIQEGRRR
jgi:hypothetical protein